MAKAVILFFVVQRYRFVAVVVIGESLLSASVHFGVGWVLASACGYGGVMACYSRRNSVFAEIAMHLSYRL